MRFGEIITLISITLSTFILFIPPRDRPILFVIFPFLLPVVLFFHIFFEGVRWQMLPAIFFAAFIVLVAIIQLQKRKRGVKIFFPNKKRNPHVLLVLFTCIFVIFIISLPVLLPIFKLPLPTGQFKVGTTQYTIHDKTRPETITKSEDDYRKFVVQIWYPAKDSVNSERENYWIFPRLFSKNLAREYNLPGFFFEHLGLVKTNSYVNLEISQNLNQYPIILFLHGGKNTDFVTDIRVFSEELASHGYITIGLTHPFSSLPIVFPDGENSACTDERKDFLRQQQQLSETLWKTFYTQQERLKEEEFLQKIFDMETMKIQEIERRVQDINTVLRWLNDIKSGKIVSIFNDKFDMDKISIVGIGLGGSVAVNAFINNDKLKACINLDGFHYTGLDAVEISKPYMLITSEESQLYTLSFIKKQLTHLSYLITIKGSTQQSFSDYSLFSPVIDMLEINGKLKYKRMADITRNYIHTFFSVYMLGKELSAWENLSKKYDKLVFYSSK